MSKEEKPVHLAHKVVIRGTVEGYDVASLEDLKKITDEFQRQQGEVDGLKRQFSDLQRFLNALNTRLERLEGFLKSFK